MEEFIAFMLSKKTQEFICLFCYLSISSTQMLPVLWSSVPCPSRMSAVAQLHLHSSLLFGDTGQEIWGLISVNHENGNLVLWVILCRHWAKDSETSLVVQWLRLHTPNAGSPGSIPGQGTRSHIPQLRVCMLQLKIPHVATKSPRVANKLINWLINV